MNVVERLVLVSSAYAYYASVRLIVTLSRFAFT